MRSRGTYSARVHRFGSGAPLSPSVSDDADLDKRHGDAFRAQESSCDHDARGQEENGQVLVWTVEGPSQTGLDRRSGSSEYLPRSATRSRCAPTPTGRLKRSQATHACPSWRLDASVQRTLESSTTEGSSPRLILGHMLVTTGGAMRVWEPYGLISECMRSSNDQRQSWIEVLNANPEAREFWCNKGDPPLSSRTHR